MSSRLLNDIGEVTTFTYDGNGNQTFDDERPPRGDLHHV